MNKDDYLIHYGVVGMKWGVRRPLGSDGRILKNSKGKPSKKNNGLSKKQQKLLDKSLSNMSDQELRTLVNRLQTEKQYKQLTSKQKKGAMAFVAGVIAASGAELAKEWVKKGMRSGGTKVAEVWKDL